MPSYIVTFFELHKQRVRVEKASSPKDALAKARNGDGEQEHRDGRYVTEFVETSDSLDPEVESEDEADAWVGE